MKSSVRVCLGLVVASTALAFAGCGDDDDDAGGPGAGGAAAHAGAAGHDGTVGHGGEAHGDGALTCQVIGELCHEADTGSGPGHDCHEVGHQGHADACAGAFDGCIALCTADEEGGQGGAGGGGSAPAPDAHCAALGELCHAVDDVNGPLHACHEVGHVGNAANCAAEFDDCATLCLAAREALEEGPGNGGAGGGGAAGSNHGGSSSAGGAAGASDGGAAQ